jgi:hypothetical protein
MQAKMNKTGVSLARMTDNDDSYINVNVTNKVPISDGTDTALEVPVAEGGPVGLSDGENRRDWFPGVRGLRTASGRTEIECHPNDWVNISFRKKERLEGNGYEI